jgi:D-alanine--poly(phosphoribitol) ligase subunit 1
VTLGPLAANFAGLVLDEHQRPVPVGEVGELYLVGPQVGLGYVNDAERTMGSFVRNPLNDAWAERTYRTGDLVRLRDDGRSIDFVGRRDNQIKHMGYRIELEEIEAALNAIDGVTQAAVMQTKIAGLTMLCAYLAVEATLTDSVLRSALERVLPTYMIPERFNQLASLPKNANGKVDRIALAQQTHERPAYA